MPRRIYRPLQLDTPACQEPVLWPHLAIEPDAAAVTSAAWEMFTATMTMSITETVRMHADTDVDTLERRVRMEAKVAMVLCLAAVVSGCESLGEAQKRENIASQIDA